MATTPRRRSKTGGTSSSQTKTRRKRSGTSQAKRSSTSSSTSGGGGLAGLTQARTIGRKLQNYHMKGLELVNEFVAMLPASRPATRGRRASTTTI
jgi:hypothetical protein